MRARAGMTLVEVMLAGSIAALVSIALMEALVVAAKVSHESSQMLSAEAYAWDTAWRLFNQSYDKLQVSTEAADYGQWFPSDSGKELTIPEEACPKLNVWPGSPAKCYVRVRRRTGQDTANSPPHGVTGTVWKEIQVDVEWGPAGARKRLNAFGSTAISNCSIPISITKCSIDRGVES